LIKLQPAPLLLLSFILKLTINCNSDLFYSIYMLHKPIFFNSMSLTLRLVLSPKLLNFITFTRSILKSLHWLKINEIIKCKVLSLTYKFLKIENWSTFTSALLITSLYSVFLDLLSPLPFSHLSSIDLKIILLLLYGTIFHLIYVSTVFITSLLLLFYTLLYPKQHTLEI